MTTATATLGKVVRDPRSGEVHRPAEQVAILAVMRNLDRALLKVRWQTVGDCVVFPEDLDEYRGSALGTTIDFPIVRKD
jgi:hypothetical protein